jgi:diguanylate cyclase (GGDEF)-like protein
VTTISQSPSLSRPRLAAPPDALPTPLTRLDELRADVAKAWLVHSIEGAPFDQAGILPVGLVVSELPALVSDIVRAAATSYAPAANDRADWLDRLDELRGASGGSLTRDLGVLHAAMLETLERSAGEFSGGDLIATASLLARLFAELQSDATDRATRRSGSAGAVADLLNGADRLTGLRAQGFGREHMRHLLSMHKRYGQPFSLLLVDIEGLKRINDAYGSEAGDNTLVGVAGAVEKAVRNVDTAVRMEEDEFCILLPNQTASRAEIAAERLAAAVEQVTDPTGNPLRISIGVVACPQHASNADDLLEQADSALFRAKAAGARVAVAADVPAEDS